MADQLVKSAVRALEICEAFGLERRRLTAAQLGQVLGYPKSSLNVLLKSLAAQGYLSYSPHELSYFPTLKLTHLGDWVPEALFAGGAPMPMLQHLRDRTGETVTLTMPSGMHMRCLRAISGSHQIGLQLDEGYLFPLFGTAIGTAYLSTLSPDTVAMLYKRAGALGQRWDGLKLAGVLAETERCRNDGYIATYDAVVSEAGAIALPLTLNEFGETLVVAVAGLNNRIKRNEATIVRELKALARTVAPKE